MIELRDYQELLMHKVRIAMAKYRNVLIQSPTGSGKTAMLVHMMDSAAKKGNSSFFCVHQGELIKQTSAALWKQKLEHGMIVSGRSVSRLPAQVASIQTLVNRTDKYDAPSMLIIDEAHRAAASSYKRVIDAYPNARVIGLTATPERTDGKGLDDIFDHIVEGPTVSELIAAGYLADYTIVAPKLADTSGIAKQAGDYNKKQAAQTMDKPSITGDAVTAYKRYANGKRCVVMCVTVQHAEHVAAQYNARGIRAEVIEGKLTSNERDAMLDRFRAGETMVICNVELLVVGVDVPAIEIVQWLRPTNSLIVWLQGVGRGLRPAKGKDKLIIIDHVGNWERHGLPDDPREWSLQGKKGREAKQDDEPAVHIKQCAECYHLFRIGPAECPSCGKPLPDGGRDAPEVVEGELVEIDLDAIRRERQKEQGAARGLNDLVKLGIDRGMTNPSGWAANVLAARSGRKANAADYKAAKDAMGAIR